MDRVRRRAGATVSIQAMVTVLDFAPEHWSSGKRLVGIVIADHADRDGYCWPSLETVARRSGLSVRLARKYLSELEAEGWLIRNSRSGSSNAYLWTKRVEIQGGADA
jgi:hypothetical protein